MADLSNAPKDGTSIRMRVYGVDTLGFWHDGGWVYVGFGGLDDKLSRISATAIEEWQPIS